MTLDEVRQTYPQYHDMSDIDLAAALHAKFYSDVPVDKFVAAIGIKPEYNAAEGEGALQQGWEGFGSTLPRLARGVKQLAGGSRQEEERARVLEKDLMDTGAGKAGRILGEGAVAAPFVAGGIPAAAAVGAAMGLAEPRAGDESRALHTVGGAAGGAVGVVAGRALPAAYRTSKALLAPFFESGQKGIAARALARSVDDPAALAAQLRGATSDVPGVQPTTAEIAQQVGPARLEKSLRQRDTAFAEDLTARQEGNNAARVADLGTVAGTDAQMAAAKQQRETIGGLLYNAARGAPVRGDAQLAQLMNRPAMQEAIAQANKIVANGGGKATPGDFLHTVKMALDDAVQTGPQQGIGAASNRALQQTRQEFLNWIETRVPEYRTARMSYSQLSAPIDQMEAGREVLRRATANTTNRAGDAALQEGKLGGLFKNEPEVLDPLNPQQRATVERAAADLSRSSNAGRLAATGGSDTAQNLIGQNMLGESLGGLSPLLGRFANTAPGRAIGSVLQLPHRLLNTEAATREQLARLLMNPQEAAKALEGITPSERAQILAALLSGTGGSAGVALTAP